MVPCNFRQHSTLEVPSFNFSATSTLKSNSDFARSHIIHTSTFKPHIVSRTHIQPKEFCERSVAKHPVRLIQLSEYRVCGCDGCSNDHIALRTRCGWWSGHTNRELHGNGRGERSAGRATHCRDSGFDKPTFQERRVPSGALVRSLGVVPSVSGHACERPL